MDFWTPGKTTPLFAFRGFFLDQTYQSRYLDLGFCARFLKPGMLVGGVIHDEIDQNPNTSLPASLRELDEISERAVAGINSVIVGNVIAIVAPWRGLKGKQPDGGYAETLQVIEAAEQALKIADAISVRIEVGCNREAIDDRIFVPQVIDHRRSSDGSGYHLALADRFYLGDIGLDQESRSPERMPSLRWWQRGVIYQIYPRSFQDSNGDGIGDLPWDYSALGLSCNLGIDAIWISPIYPSPMADFGYDVADYCAVAAVFGTLADFDRLVAEAHSRGLRLILDFVPNHTSNEHPWFLESRSSRDNPKRDWYIWRDAARSWRLSRTIG